MRKQTSAALGVVARRAGKAAPFARIEWPTLAVAGVMYAAFVLLTVYYDALAWWLLAPLAGATLTVYGSLTHEVIHGHPTRDRRFNRALVWPCLWLWFPFGLYRDSHLSHHRDRHLTDPLLDPESHYLVPAHWQRLRAPLRALLLAHNTLAGRLLLGAPIALVRLLFAHLPALLRAEAAAWRLWGAHALACAPVLAWLWMRGIPLVEYLLLFVWPAIALTQLRTFAEHRAAAQVGERSAVVEAGPLFSLLFLNNNLHAVHHAAPGVAWYRLPALWRAERARFEQVNGGYVFDGYGDLARRYLLRVRAPVAHPLMTMPAPAATAEAGDGSLRTEWPAADRRVTGDCPATLAETVAACTLAAPGLEEGRTRGAMTERL